MVEIAVLGLNYGISNTIVLEIRQFTTKPVKLIYEATKCCKVKHRVHFFEKLDQTWESQKTSHSLAIIDKLYLIHSYSGLYLNDIALCSTVIYSYNSFCISPLCHQ